MTAAESPTFMADLEAASASRTITVNALYVLLGFKFRMVLSHVRTKRRQWLKQDEVTKSASDAMLITLYMAMDLQTR